MIYFGLMLTRKGPKVLEFNVRFGDPETEAVIPLVKSDLARALLDCCDQRLDKPVDFNGEKHCVTVVCASRGYPEKPEIDKEITGLDSISKIEGAMVFHSGTYKEGGKFFTNGGRVLNCVGTGRTFEEARLRAYQAVQKIHFDGMHYRKDIGASNSAIPSAKTVQPKVQPISSK